MASAEANSGDGAHVDQTRLLDVLLEGRGASQATVETSREHRTKGGLQSLSVPCAEDWAVMTSSVPNGPITQAGQDALDPITPQDPGQPSTPDCRGTTPAAGQASSSASSQETSKPAGDSAGEAAAGPAAATTAGVPTAVQRLEEQRAANLSRRRLLPENAADSSAVRGAMLAPGQRVAPEHFDLLRVIGRGAYGKVLLVRHKGTRAVYAMKVADKAYLVRRGQVDYSHVERNIMAAVRHPFLVGLRFAFQTPASLYLVMDFAAGGDMLAHIGRHGLLPTDAVVVYAAEMALALEHLHSLGIIHRDLKPENILLDAQGHVQLTDYGLAKVVGTGRTRTLCGTTEYMAPEMVAKPEGGYTSAVDWWSLGAVLYEMLTGRPPFEGKDHQALYRKILSAPVQWPRHLRPKAKSLLQGLLERSPEQRMGARSGSRFTVGGVAGLKQHGLFKGLDWHALAAKAVPAPMRVEVVSDTDVTNFDAEFTSLPLLDDAATGRVVVGKAGVSSAHRAAAPSPPPSPGPSSSGDQEQEALPPPPGRFRGFSFVHPDLEGEYSSLYSFGGGGDGAPPGPSEVAPHAPTPSTVADWVQAYDTQRRAELAAEAEAAAAAAEAAAQEAARAAARAKEAQAAGARSKGRKGGGRKKRKGAGGGGVAKGVPPAPVPVGLGKKTTAQQAAPSPTALRTATKATEALPPALPADVPPRHTPKSALHTPPGSSGQCQRAGATAAVQPAQPSAKPAEQPYKASGFWAALAAGQQPRDVAGQPAPAALPMRGGQARGLLRGMRVDVDSSAAPAAMPRKPVSPWIAAVGKAAPGQAARATAQQPLPVQVPERAWTGPALRSRTGVRKQGKPKKQPLDWSALSLR